MAAYEDLKSSGNLIILRDDMIKKQVIEYYSMLDGMIDVMNTNADGAVKLFYDKEDYAEIGWQYLSFVHSGIDTTKINFQQLMPKDFDLEKFRKTMTSDAIFYVGANWRIKFLYETVLPSMTQMETLLRDKCE
jgi:hypothetical protein